MNVETRALHANAGAHWSDLVAPGRPIVRQTYVRYLEVRYGFEAPLEAALTYTPGLGSVVGLPGFFRAISIANDLVAAGMRPARLAEIGYCAIAPFESVAEALGWLYVHQRSTLLGTAVAAELVARDPELASATSHFRLHDGQVESLADQLGMAMDRVATTEEVENLIVRAAKDAFRIAYDWERQALQLPPQRD